MYEKDRITVCRHHGRNLFHQRSMETGTVDQGDDYSGHVVSTVVRKTSPCSSGTAVLYIHGFNDYFFQKELGDSVTAHCMDFYAVDLRKYGRSLLPGQRHCEARDIREYYADIDSALAMMRQDSVDRVVLMGHSTGGLITSSYMADEPDSMVSALILNSPFLDWNLGKWTERAVPLVAAAGKLFPDMSISQGGSTAYSESLLRGDHGEWSYDTDWKEVHSPDVTAGWIRAIDNAQQKLQSGRSRIHVPILLMHSDKSVHWAEWNPEFQKGDAVLDVAEISEYGRKLGPDITEATVYDGLHDLILSAPGVRKAVYRSMFNWLNRKLQ